MTDANVYYTGFAMVAQATLEFNGAAQDPSTLGTISAALVKRDRSGLAAGSTVVTCTLPGDGTVVASWSAAQTAAITPGSYLIEYRTTVGPYCHEGIPVTLQAGVSP